MALFNGTLLHLLLPHKTYEEYTALAATAALHCLHSWQKKRGANYFAERKTNSSKNGGEKQYIVTVSCERGTQAGQWTSRNSTAS